MEHLIGTISSLELPFFSSLGFGRLEGEWVDETRAFVLVNLMVMLVVIMAQHNKWQPLGLEVAQFQLDSFHDDEDISTESTPAASTQHRLIIAPAA
ncbi:hypothetical protein AAMO2058_000166100 [Amorphochlora amoebiformis]